MYRLFSWEHSYFSGKTRAHLRYKQHFGGLGPGFEDVLATREIIEGVLVPATGTNVVPQLRTPDGSWVQDTSEIVDFIEREHPEPPVVPPTDGAPRQRLLCYLIELLADEWMLVYAFWERWYYSRPDVEPNHEQFNAQQWGSIINASGNGQERLDAARFVFQNVMGMQDPDAAGFGPYPGLRSLGVSKRTREAWQASNARVLEALDAHLHHHDFVLGGLPSLADFGLMGPLYAHLFRDAVPGFEMRLRYPLVAEWVERTNGSNALNARSYNQRLYDVGEGGRLLPKPATSDGGAWLPDDAIPETLLPLVAVFFDEMWPVLTSSMERLTRYLASAESGVELPGKSFLVTEGFEELQTGDGPLTLSFEIGGVRERRMLLPYQVWMLQRLADVLRECTADPGGRASVASWLAQFERGPELFELDSRLAGCRVRKQNGRLFADAPR
jgi:glutathione S-transferase